LSFKLIELKYKCTKSSATQKLWISQWME